MKSGSRDDRAEAGPAREAGESLEGDPRPRASRATESPELPAYYIPSAEGTSFVRGHRASTYSALLRAALDADADLDDIPFPEPEGGGLN